MVIFASFSMQIWHENAPKYSLYFSRQTFEEGFTIKEMINTPAIISRQTYIFCSLQIPLLVSEDFF